MKNLISSASLFLFLLTPTYFVFARVHDNTLESETSKVRKSKEPQVAILNGSDLLAGAPAFDFTIFLSMYGNDAFCTGTLIAPNKILTAAHCIEDILKWKFHALLMTEGGVVRERVEIYGSDIVMHPTYESEILRIQAQMEEDRAQNKAKPRATYRNRGVDLAIIGLRKSFLLAKPLTVSQESTRAENYTLFYNVGPQRDENDAKVVTTKMGYVTHTLRRIQLNEPIYRDFVSIDREEYTYVCKGDSGGPMLGVSLNGSVGLVGVGSFISVTKDGQFCSGFSGFVKLETRFDWLQSTVSQMDLLLERQLPDYFQPKKPAPPKEPMPRPRPKIEESAPKNKGKKK